MWTKSELDKLLKMLRKLHNAIADIINFMGKRDCWECPINDCEFRKYAVCVFEALNNAEDDISYAIKLTEKEREKNV